MNEVAYCKELISAGVPVSADDADGFINPKIISIFLSPQNFNS
jgi:hypothetical protein